MKNIPVNRRMRRDEAKSRPPVQLDLPEGTDVPVSRPWFDRARRIFGIVLLGAIAVGLALGLRFYVRKSPRFAVSEIQVTGGARRSSEEISERGGVRVGQNIFLVDLARTEQALLADPWVSRARITRKLPGTIRIEVSERKAAALVAISETYLATAEGQVFKKLEAGDPMDLPIVSGIDVAQFYDDKSLVEATVRRALALAGEYAEAELAPKYPLQEVHVDSNGTMSLRIGKQALTLMLGKPPYRRKLEQASVVVHEAERRGAKMDTVLLDNDSRQDRVIVRLR